MIKLITKSAVTIITILLIALLSTTAARAEEPLPEFFSALYTERLQAFKTTHEEEYLSFCRAFDIDPDDSLNQEKCFKLLFYHKMFTGTASYDGAVGGMLKIPYFWHWITPNPRHKILDNQSGELLLNRRPPERFARYKSHADIDRVPSIYLSDLVTEEPGYRHKECGEFYSFGWCSEREMAFSLFMGLYGYKSKIVQTGIHVTSDFWLILTNSSGGKTTLIAQVDNTYDTIYWEKVNGTKFKAWYNDMGSIQMVNWYNKKARSKSELKLVKSILLGPVAAKRIIRLAQ